MIRMLTMSPIFPPAFASHNYRLKPWENGQQADRCCVRVSPEAPVRLIFPTRLLTAEIACLLVDQGLKFRVSRS
jgi:hypothetical protein